MNYYSRELNLDSSVFTPSNSTLKSISEISENVNKIVFIDAKVADYHHLVKGVTPGTKIVILNSEEDGIQQITETLHKSPESLVILVAHGLPGALQLGNSQLSLETLDSYKEELKSWFSPNFLPHMLMIYGCNVAMGDAGEEFVTKLHKITGANIAASTTLIGNTDLGGDWHLDFTTNNQSLPMVFTTQVMESYLHTLAIGIDELDASYINLPLALSENYTIQGVGSNTGTIYSHNFRSGEENNLILSGFSAGGEDYTLLNSFDEVILNRVDNANVTGEREILWYEQDSISGTQLNLQSGAVDSMETTLLDNVINRGTDNIFTNRDNSEGNETNIERVDFLSLNGLSVPEYQLDDFGFLILERGGNDAFQVAPIIAVDAQGNASAFGDLVTVDAQTWGESSYAIDSAIGYQDESDANVRYSISRTNQTISGIFFSYEDLGITGDQIFYGYSIFPPDVTTENDLVGLSDVPDNTTEGDTGLDLISSTIVRALTLSEPPNELPIATDDSATTTVGESVAIEVLINDSDPDGDTLEIIQVGQGNRGTVSIDDNGTVNDSSDDFLVYTPNLGSLGTDTFTYTISDGNGGTDTANVNVNIQVNTDTLGDEGEAIFLKDTLLGADAQNVNEVGVYKVDDEAGTIDGIAPGEDGYIEAAFSNGQVIFSVLGNTPDLFDSNPTRLIEGFDSTHELGYFLISNSSMDQVLADLAAGGTSSDVSFSLSPEFFFSYREGNVDNEERALIQEIDEDTTIVSWEDSDDDDFNDLVIQVDYDYQPGEDELPLGQYNPQLGSSETEIIDLSEVSGQVRADFQEITEAAFDDSVGLYRIENATGTVIDAVTGQSFSPGDAGYTDAAWAASVVEFDESGTDSVILDGNSFYAPYLVVEDTGSIYFPFLEANDDGFDHLRLLGNNTFGFEDTSNNNNSDNDFDDFVFSVELSVI